MSKIKLPTHGKRVALTSYLGGVFVGVGDGSEIEISESMLPDALSKGCTIIQDAPAGGSFKKDKPARKVSTE